MTTPRTRALASFAVTMTALLAPAACARPVAHPALDSRPVMEAVPLNIRFDNDARDYVHVYLIGQERQWLLGRVEAESARTLHIPEESLRRNSQFIRLAVIEGDRVTVDAARNPRARFTVGQPMSMMVSQRWTFAQGELTSLKLPRSVAGKSP